MKKYITCTLLLILSFLIGTKNAYAIIGTAEFVGGEYSTGITWCSKGMGAGECRAYTDHKKDLKINGHTLIKISGGRNVKYVEGDENIKVELGI